MIETLIVVVVILLIVAVIAVVGHGIWVLVAMIFRGRRRRGREQQPCVFCGRMTPKALDRCDWCGRHLQSPLANELTDLEAVQRQLKRFRTSGALKAAVVEGLLGRVQGYRTRLLRPTAAPPAAAPASPFAAPPPAAQPKEPIVAELVQEPPKPAAPAAKPQAAPPAKPQAAPPKPKPAARPAKPQAAPPKPKPRPPKKSWGEVLAGFMKERDIHWAELIGVLVGGMLMVGSSVALVINLWGTLELYPYLKFFVFVAYSSVVFIAGLYAYHRWKLESTGRGLLVIATLLVPLNFLVMANPPGEDGQTLTLAAELVSLGIFAWLVSLAGRVLVPGGRWLAVLAVVGNSGAVLLSARLIDPQPAAWLFIALGCLPVAFFGAAVGGYLYRLSEKKDLDASRANALFTLLGAAVFALVVALGLLVAEAGGIAGCRNRLSVLVALAAMPILACGLAVIRSAAKGDRFALCEAPSGPFRQSEPVPLGAYHAAGTWIALVGMIAMLVALGLAWPHPLGIIAVGTLNCAALVSAAFYCRLPILHAGAIACLALVYLTIFHVVYPHSELPPVPGGKDLGPQMLALTFDASSGTALGGLFVILGLVAEWLARTGRHRHGAIYAGGCGVVAVVGLLLVTWHGFAATEPADALRAAVLYAVYGAGSLGLVARWRRAELSYLGLGLLSAAPMWALWWFSQTHDVSPPFWAALLGVEALIMAVAAAVLHRYCGREPGGAWTAGAAALKSASLVDLYRIPLLHVAELVAPAAVALGVATAWSDRASIAASPSPCPVVTAGCLAALYLLLAWGYRSRERTWVGSMILLAGLVHTLRFNYELAYQPWLVPLLLHSTLAVAAGVLLDLWTKGRSSGDFAEAVGRVFSKPLGDTALLSSVLTLFVLPLVPWADAWPLALCLFWLAAIWLVIAWSSGNAVLFSAHQAMLSLAAVVATTAWLTDRTGITDISREWFLPRSLQVYGIGLGLLSLAWVAVRIILRGEKVAQELLNPDWPAVDWIVRHAVVWGQLLLAGCILLPGIAEELVSAFSTSPAAKTSLLAACGPRAWTLLGILAVMLIVTLWDRWRNAEMVSSLLLAAAVPCLLAGRLADGPAVASALRWGLAGCFVVCSVAVWGRRQLLELCNQAKTNVEVDPAAPRIARATLLATTAVPVLALTVLAAMLQFAEVTPGELSEGTFFQRLGPNISYVVPLVLVMLGLVGHAIRERSAGYAFSAGLVTELVVTLGYALSVVTDQDPTTEFGTREFVRLIQLATITAAAWAGAWLMIRHWLNIWREESVADVPPAAGQVAGTQHPSSGRWHAGPTPRLLMNVQLGMGAAGNVLLIGLALVSLALFQQFGPDWQKWTAAAGSPWGWIALAAVVAAYVYRAFQTGRRLQPQMVGLLGMSVLGLMACTVGWQTEIQQWNQNWAYRTLMLGWAAYALFIVSATWWVATLRTLPEAHGPPQALIRAAAVWVRVAGILAVLLGLKAAFLHVAVFGADHEELLWAAGAIAVASAAGATMAVWRRQEGWAFSAALGVNLAASLVVWYFRYEDDFGRWWLRLIQANVIASSAVALVWLAVRRRLYQLRELSLGESPLLAAQTAIPVLGNLLLLIVPVLCLVVDPADLPQHMPQWAEVPGWLGLLFAAAAAGWYLRQVLPGNLPHVLGGLGLGAGVLLACYMANVSFADRPTWNAWLEYHTLITAWAAVGLAVLAAGILCRNLRLSAEDDGQSIIPKWDASPAATGRPLLPGSLVQGWVTVIGALVVVLAVIHSAEDRAGVWWYLGAILAASVMAGILAMWLRRPAYVYISGLLLMPIGIIAWIVWGPSTVNAFFQASVLPLAIGSGVWSLLRLTHRDGVPHVQSDGQPLPYANLAAGLAVVLLAAVVGVAACDVLGLWQIDVDIERLDWIALAATAAALTICLWDRCCRLAIAGLYVLGLLAVGMGLCARGPAPEELCHGAAVALAGFVLATAALGGLLPRLKEAWDALRIPEDNRRWPADWFPAIQAAVAGTVALLSVWISIDSRFDATAHPSLGWLSGRMVGPLAVVLLLPAAILLTRRCKDRWRAGWQYAALGLGVAILSESGWAWLAPDGRLAWLHGSVILMVAAVVMSLVAGLGLRRLVPESSDWIAAGRRVTPVFGGLAVVALAAVLVQEGFLPRAETDVLVAWPAVVVVVVALAALGAGCLAFAVVARWDPLDLSERGRTAYVYAAEALGALIGLHLWLTRPKLFQLGIVETWWMLMVMAVAFAGAGLSELFQRRRLPVLSEPLERTALLLPLVPAIGYWFMTETTAQTWFLGDASPAMWFMMGLFYGVMATSRRSIVLSGLAIFTANMGLWVLWQQRELSFYDHPQLWLIPLALAALVAEHLDRGRLTQVQRTSLRYIALGVIYVSSTTEFMRGIYENSIVLPLVTILLSVAGVAAGVVLRVRSFLYLGITFLMVVIVRMIVYAAFEQGQMWVFWTFSSLLGAAIIYLVAIFEKRRNDILAAVERLKDWQR